MDLYKDKPEKVAAVIRLVLARHDDGGRYPRALLFADLALPAPVRRFWLAARVTNTWLQHVMWLLLLHIPLGGRYQEQSLRGGPGNEAYAIGLPLPTIAELMGHASIETTLSNYVQTQWRATPAARAVLGRFLPRHLRL